uniref:Uncharacterized protein n=1 Tax=Onchocerca volvulus TaxID=6282 RepID=A0A8R1XQ61_ONCVO
MSCFQRGMVVDIVRRENIHQISFKTQNLQISTPTAPSLYHLYFIFCCPAHAGRSKISLQATAVETLGRNIQLPQTWVIKPILLLKKFPKKTKHVYNTWDSQAVSDPSTNQAQRCLT